MRSSFAPLLLSFALALGCVPAKATYKDDIGYTELQLELGAAMPTGAGVGVSQTEAPVNTTTPYIYLPNTGLAEFVGKSFVTLSGAGGISGHATTVAQYFFGSTTSIGTGITSIHSFEANDWIQTGFLNYGTTSPPFVETQQIENNSWIGTAGGAIDVELLRRFDFAIERDNFLAVSGLNNGSGSGVPTLMGNSYDGLIVGLSTGNHSSGQTTIEGAGRIKPDIVCITPENLTSFATPVVGAAGAILRQKALSLPALNSAGNSVALKALLMAGATKTGLGGTWSRPANSTQPMDLHYGAGQLNIFNSYHILVAGRQSASSATSVKSRGWDYTGTTAGGSLYYFDIAPGDSSSAFTAVLTWNRVIADGVAGADWGSPTSALPNIFLKLYSASGFSLGAQVDASVSTIDNVQVISQPNLAPGRYALQVTSATTSVNYGLAWYSLPTVTVLATPPNASERGPVSAVFEITRAGDVTDALKVNYTIGGTASSSTDYTAIPASVTIPAGASVATISVAPIPDTLAEGDETVTLTLANDFAYSPGAPSAATVTIHDQPFDAWRFAHFTPAQINDPSPANVTTATAIPAADGIVNLVKYALNLDPPSAQNTSLPVFSLLGASSAQFAFTRNLAATDVTLAVEACTDLTKPPGDPAGWQTIASRPAGASSWTTTGGVTVSDTAGAVKVTISISLSTQPVRFLRLRTSL